MIRPLLALSALLALAAAPARAIIDRDASQLDRYMEEARKVLQQPEAALAYPNVPLVTKDDFRKEVVESKRAVLVLFCSDKVQRCGTMYEVFEEISKQAGGRFKAVRVDVETDLPLLVQQLPKGATSYEVPSIYLFIGGRSQKEQLVPITDAQGNVTGVRLQNAVP